MSRTSVFGRNRGGELLGLGLPIGTADRVVHGLLGLRLPIGIADWAV